MRQPQAAILVVAASLVPFADPFAVAAASRAARTGANYNGPSVFRSLGAAPQTGHPIFAKAVSADGSTVVGYSLAPDKCRRAMRWTGNEEGWRALDRPDSGRETEALAVSGDGAVIVGRILLGKGASSRAFRWTEADGVREIPGVTGDSIATSLAVDGRSFAGESGRLAFAATAESAAPQSLGAFEGGQTSVARSLSLDGSVVVGFVRAASGAAPRAFRWDAAAGGMQELLPGGPDAMAEAVSGDGLVVTGQMRDRASNAWHAFRWTQQTGAVDLRTLGGPMSAALAVNADGSVVVGRAECGESIDRAFRWTAKKKMQDLRAELMAQGVTELQGWTLVAATGVSADGSVITGYGRNPENRWESFRAMLAR